MKRGKLGYTCYGVDYEVCDIRKGWCGSSKKLHSDELDQSIVPDDPAAEDIRDFVKKLLRNSPCGDKYSSHK